MTDRSHLVQNARTTLNNLVRAGRRSVSWTTEEPAPTIDRPPSATNQQRAARRQAQVVWGEKMRARREAAWNLAQTAQEMATDRKAVRRRPCVRGISHRTPRPTTIGSAAGSASRIAPANDRRTDLFHEPAGDSTVQLEQFELLDPVPVALLP